jgi:integrase
MTPTMSRWKTGPPRLPTRLKTLEIKGHSIPRFPSRFAVRLPYDKIPTFRGASMTGIVTVRQRQSLPSRREPFWHVLGTGQHLGYRVTDGSGYWVARLYDAGTRKRVYRSLGDLATVTDADRFSHASRLAREWFAHLASGGQTDVVDVAGAWKAYIKHQRERKRKGDAAVAIAAGKAAAKDAEARYKRHVEHDPIARVQLLKLTAHHVAAWRKRIEDMPAISARRGPRSKPALPSEQTRPRSAATLNRDITAMRAALNYAKSNGFVTSDLAWTKSLTPIEGADGRRDVYLTRDQRRALLDAIESENLRTFARALCLLPFRPGALAALRVGDFNARTGSVLVRQDKAHAGRSVPLPDAVRELFRECAKSKLPTAPLFARADGEPWNKDSWKGPVKDAVRVAKGVPADATLYALRHSTITDLVTNGLDLFSVATLAGTSVRMIEATYAHLQHDHAKAALDRLAL